MWNINALLTEINKEMRDILLPFTVINVPPVAGGSLRRKRVNTSARATASPHLQARPRSSP